VIGRKAFGAIFKYSKVLAAVLIVASLVLAAIGTPSWVLRTIVAALFLTFPFVMVLSWALSSEPLEGTRPRPWDMPIPSRTPAKPGEAAAD
jgi:hypothetical protein